MKRGPCNLAKYVHTKGSRHEKEKAIGQNLQDFEFFCVNMGKTREWKPTKCQQEWNILKNDRSVFRAYGGPKTKDPDRKWKRRCPSNI